MLRGSVAALVSLSVLLALVVPSAAQDRAAEGRALYDEARAAMQAKDYDTACGKFEQSYRIAGVSGSLLSWADCEETRGKLGKAYRLWQQGEAKVVADPERRAFARQRLLAVEPRVGKVTVRLAAPVADAWWSIDGERMPRFDEPVAVDPGHHQVEALGGGTHDKQDIEVAAGGSATITVLAGAHPLPPLSAPPSPPTTAPLAPPPERHQGLRTAAWVSGAVGVVGLAAFSVSGGLVLAECSGTLDPCGAGGARDEDRAPAFMPPEQALAQWSKVDARSDVYAIGASMFSLLLGRSVHQGDTLPEFLVAVATQPAPKVRALDPAIPAALAAVIDRALASDMQERWPDADAMLDALAAVDSAGPERAEFSSVAATMARPPFTVADDASAAPLSNTLPGERPTRRRWLLPAGLIGAALAAITLGIMSGGKGGAAVDAGAEQATTLPSPVQPSAPAGPAASPVAPAATPLPVPVPAAVPVPVPVSPTASSVAPAATPQKKPSAAPRPTATGAAAATSTGTPNPLDYK
ncbi:MAG: hypothetical protein WKG00_13940 [Polyangiaceae bacterium]